MTSRVERASPEDVTNLASERATAPMQAGAILVLDTPNGLDARKAVDVLAARIRSIPRLRQRLVPVPVGCGRPIWVDDADFDISRHVRVATCPGSGDERALLDLAADVSATRLPTDRPFWSATLVEGVHPHHSALIVVFHHVLTDGIGGLAVLARLVDDQPAPSPDGFPQPAASKGQIALDALRGHLQAITRLPGAMRRLGAAIAEMRATKAPRPTRTSLNQPTGPHRRFGVARADLEEVRAVAHAHGATVNDVVLAAVAGALLRLLASRGEEANRLVASVPVSRRRLADADVLGNQVDVVPIELPVTADLRRRLETIAVATREAKRTPRGASAALLGPTFRILARLGLFAWFIDRQRLVTTFVTNMRGPPTPLAFTGAPISGILPVSVITGNVTVAFAVLSYAGTLAITVITDPDACPDRATLHAALQDELNRLTESAPAEGARP